MDLVSHLMFVPVALVDGVAHNANFHDVMDSCRILLLFVLEKERVLLLMFVRDVWADMVAQIARFQSVMDDCGTILQVFAVLVDTVPFLTFVAIVNLPHLGVVRGVRCQNVTESLQTRLQCVVHEEPVLHRMYVQLVLPDMVVLVAKAQFVMDFLQITLLKFVVVVEHVSHQMYARVVILQMIGQDLDAKYQNAVEFQEMTRQFVVDEVLVSTFQISVHVSLDGVAQHVILLCVMGNRLETNWPVVAKVHVLLLTSVLDVMQDGLVPNVMYLGVMATKLIILQCVLVVVLVWPLMSVLFVQAVGVGQIVKSPLVMVFNQTRHQLCVPEEVLAVRKTFALGVLLDGVEMLVIYQFVLV